MGSVWSVGLVNCHISDKNNMDRLLSGQFDEIGHLRVVETWFRGEEGKARRDGILQNTNFVWVGKDREGRRGGIGFLVRKGVKLRIPKGGRAEGLLWIEVEDGKGKIFLGLVYLAPGSFPKVREVNEEVWDELTQDITFFKGQGRVCILGDWNCRIGEQESRIASEEEEREVVFKRKSQDRKVNKAGKELINFMNDHELIILNGILEEALLTSIQVGGGSVIDYIISDQNFYRQIKNCRTWEEEYTIVSDHRLLTIEVEGRLEEKISERKAKREEKEGGRRGWRRVNIDIENFQQICDGEWRRWCEEYREGEKHGSEKVWQTWLDTHNRVAEEGIGRYKRKKIKDWVKGEWDQGIFEAVREKNRLRREMGRVRGEERQKVVGEYRKWRQVVRQITVAKGN